MASIGITNVPSGLLPGSGVAEEVSIEQTKEVKTLRDKAGITKHAAPMGFTKTTTTVRGYGDGTSIFNSVTGGPFASGKKLIEIKASESNEDFPKFEATEVSYS